MQVNGDWSPLGDLFYRKSELYQMQWTSEIDLNRCHIIACRFGGPIAIIPLDDNIVRQRQATMGTQLSVIGKATFYTDPSGKHVPNFPSKPTILTYTCSGNRISVGKSKAIDVVSIDWTHDQQLMIVTTGGDIYIYDIQGVLQMEQNLDLKIAETGPIVDCQCVTPNDTYTSLAFITQKTNSICKFFISNRVSTTQESSKHDASQTVSVTKLPDVPSLNVNNMCWAVMTKALNQQNLDKGLVQKGDYNLSLVVSNGSNLYLLEGSGHSTCQSLHMPSITSSSLIHRIAVSFDSSRLALFMNTGHIFFISICAEDSVGYAVLTLSEFDTKSKKPPIEMLWCANEAVCALWKNKLLMVGLDKDYILHVVDSPTHLIGELDCIRLISNQYHEILRQVSPVSVEIFRVGTISSAALLVEAYKLYKRGNLQAYLNIQSIRERDEMHLAVLSCIEAAGSEYQVAEQKLLIEAACFGKRFDPGIAIIEYQTMWSKLRVLNLIRKDPIAIPMTYCQYEYLTISTVLNHVVQRSLYSYALWIAEWLKMPKASGETLIIAHWAYNLVRKAHLDDDSITREIRSKLASFPLISYADVARQAIDCGRVQLAIKLLCSEPDSSKKVPLLLDLKQFDQVFLSALDSYDCNLIFLAIFRLQGSIPDENRFVTTLRKHSYAFSLYQNYLSQTDIQKLIMISYNGKDHEQESRSYLISFRRDRTSNNELRCINQLDSAVKSYRKTKNEFAAQQTDQKLKLYKYQLELKGISIPPLDAAHLCPDLVRLNARSEYPTSASNKWLNLSLSHTIINLLALKDLVRARECQKRFEVPENKFQYLDKIANNRLEPLTLPTAQ